LQAKTTATNRDANKIGDMCVNRFIAIANNWKQRTQGLKPGISLLPLRHD
jgi:hypothetical protein